MFVVIAYGNPEYSSEIVKIEGIVYSEADFNRWLDQNFSGIRSTVKPEHGYDGPLSISYDLAPHYGDRAYNRVSMQKIEEIGKPPY